MLFKKIAYISASIILLMCLTVNTAAFAVGEKQQIKKVEQQRQFITIPA